MNSSPTYDARAKRDGCGCPSWVWCVHFDETTLTISDVYGAAEAHECDLADYEGPPFGVGFCRSSLPCPDCNRFPFQDMGGRADYFFDFNLAQAEFDRREEELRRSSPVPGGSTQ